MTAHAIIERLDMSPHPEGGWYRETWRAGAAPGLRAAGTAILFLLEAGQASHWHRVDADELWLWHAGSPLVLELAAGDAGPIAVCRLGPDILSGATPQVRVPAGQWQAARAGTGWALMSCVVVRGSISPASRSPRRTGRREQENRMVEACWRDTVIASSDQTVVVERNHYFPVDSADAALLRPSGTTSQCPWKGTAHYYSVVVDGVENSDAAWYYPDPKPEAARIRGRIAFWKGVTVG